ncbi:hypothetical protein BH18ACT15_BH18ACT15_03180 [soil metagenome]
MRENSLSLRVRRSSLFSPSAAPGRASHLLWAAALSTLGAGLVCFIAGLYVVSLWLFVACAVAVALVLPLEYALVSPLFMGLIGWLVDMLPLLILVGWLTAVARWAFGLIAARRLPRAGKFVVIPLFLVGWTALGAYAVLGTGDVKHFILLFGLQVLISGAVLAVVDSLDEPAARARVAAALVSYLVLLSAGVLLDWVGVPLQELQSSAARARVEAAYGLDAFPNSVGMVKYTTASDSGAGELRSELRRVAERTPGMPGFKVFKPRFHAYPQKLIARFSGTARPVEEVLAAHGIELIYDNVGVAQAHTVPRMRSFPRNSLTYAGISAALFPFALYLAATGEGRRRWIGRLGLAAALFGAGFSLARGAWAVVALAIVYLIVDGAVSKRLKLSAVLVYLLGALVLTGVFLGKYGQDPLHARAGAEGSIGTRKATYGDTLASVGGLSFLIGYGTEAPRTGSGVSHLAGRYIPRAGTHSTYLNYLFRSGVPGMVAIMALYLVAFLHARAAARNLQARERIFASMAATAMVIVGAHAVILSLYVEPAYTLTISLIVGLAVAGATSLSTSVLPWRTGRAGG